MSMPKIRVHYSGIDKNSLYEKKGNEKLSTIIKAEKGFSIGERNGNLHIDRRNYKFRKQKFV